MWSFYVILKSIFLCNTLQIPEQDMFTDIGIQQCAHIKQSVGSYCGL